MQWTDFNFRMLQSSRNRLRMAVPQRKSLGLLFLARKNLPALAKHVQVHLREHRQIADAHHPGKVVERERKVEPVRHREAPFVRLAEVRLGPVEAQQFTDEPSWVEWNKDGVTKPGHKVRNARKGQMKYVITVTDCFHQAPAEESNRQSRGYFAAGSSLDGSNNHHASTEHLKKRDKRIARYQAEESVEELRMDITVIEDCWYWQERGGLPQLRWVLGNST